MCNRNALSIQSQLQSREFVSIPWLQQTYQLSYTEAKQFYQRLLIRGWVSEQADGIRYAVRPENLKLRKLCRREAEQLYPVYTHACSILMCALASNSTTGAAWSTLSRRVRGEKEAVMALKVLLDANLLYLWGDLFFPCISKRDIDMLADMMDLKRRESRLRELLEGEACEGLPPKVAELFEEYFRQAPAD